MIRAGLGLKLMGWGEVELIVDLIRNSSSFWHYDSHGNTQHDTNNKQFFNKLGFMFSTKPWMSVLYSRTSVLCSRTSVLSSRTDSRCLSQPRSYVITIYVPSFIYVMDLPYENIYGLVILFCHIHIKIFYSNFLQVIYSLGKPKCILNLHFFDWNGRCPYEATKISTFMECLKHQNKTSSKNFGRLKC